MAADDAVAAQQVLLGVEEVHAAAEAAIEAVALGENFCQRAVEREIDGEVLAARVAEFFDCAQDASVEVAAHDAPELVDAEFVNGRQALGEDFTVAAVRTENQVVGRQPVRLPDGGALLSDRQMRRPAMVVGDAFPRPFFFNAVEHGLELAQDQHVAVHAQQAVAAVERCFGAGVRLVGVERNFRAVQHAACADVFGVDGEGFGHVWGRGVDSR